MNVAVCFYSITIKAMVSLMNPDAASDLHIKLSANIIRYLRNSWMAIEKIQTGLPEMLWHLYAKELYRPPRPIRWTIRENEMMDEIIFRTIKPRNRLILELMARGGMRIGEVLELTPSDIEDRKLTLRTPKSGKEREIVFIPQKIADRPRNTQPGKELDLINGYFQYPIRPGERLWIKQERWSESTWNPMISGNMQPPTPLDQECP